MYKAKIYGDFSVKFRAFGIDFGYAKKTITADQGVILSLPIQIEPMQIAFNERGVKLDAFIVPVS